MRIAGIDIGSNSVRALVAETAAGRVEELASRRLATRLGEGINRGVLQETAMRRTLDALVSFLAGIRVFQPQAVAAVATSAVRDAANGPDFVRAVRKRLGLNVRVLDGAEEALLSWHGVRAGLDLDGSSLVVMDVGGGSTEFTWMDGGRLQAVSVQAGAVRLTESGLGAGRTAALLAPALARIRAARPKAMAGAGGTLTTAAAMRLGLTAYERGRLHGRKLSRADVDGLVARVAACSRQERERLAGLAPERADIIAAGLTIVAQALAGLGLDSLVVSETGLLHGLVLATAGSVGMTHLDPPLAGPGG